MTSPRALLRRALEILTGFVLIPVAGEFFIEIAKGYHLYDYPSEKAENIINTLFRLANNPSYRIIAALIVGLLIGMLLDSFLRHREGNGTTKLSLVEGWFSPIEARDRFPKFLKDREAAKAALEKARRNFEAVTQPMIDLDDDKINASELLKAQDEVEDKRTMYSIIWDECIDDLYKQLQAGILIAKGFRDPHKHGNDAVTIPKDEWTFLELNFDEERASMKNSFGSFGYIGIRIGKPKASPLAPLPIPELQRTKAET